MEVDWLLDLDICKDEIQNVTFEMLGYTTSYIVYAPYGLVKPDYIYGAII